MDNKEKISVELELLTSKFSNKIRETTGKIKEFGQTAKEQFQIGKNIDVSSAKNKIKELENELKKLQEQSGRQSLYGGKVDNSAKIKRIQMSIRNLNNDISQAESNFGKFGQRISKIINSFQSMGSIKDKLKINEVGNEFDSASGKAEKFSQNVKKSFDKGIRNIKRFALSLFSIRSIWSLISRATSSYISEDIELSNKLRAVWIGLGSIFAPIIEFIANGLLRIVMYLNAFIKGLFKVDLLANAISKSTAKSAKSAKEAAKSLAGFDEINNIDTSSGGSDSDPSWASAFDNVNVNTKWMEKLETWGKKIRDIWDEVVKHWKEALLIIGIIGAGVLVFKLLSKSSLTAGTSLLGLAVTLGGLALLFMSIADLVKAINEGNMEMSDIVNLLLVSFTAVAGLMAVISLLGPSMTAGMAPFAVVMTGIVALLFTLKATLPTILGAVSDFITSTAPALVDILNTIFDGIDKIINALGKTLPPIIDSIGKSFERVFSGIARIVDSVFNGVSKVIDTIGNTIVKILNTISGTINEVLNGILNFINKLGPAINNFVDNCIAAVTKLINFMISGIEYLINTLIIGGINKLIKAINSLGKYVGFTIPSVDNLYIQRFVPRYDVGTNYVPNDQLAMVHKGEAIVPKKFNNQEFFGIGNEEILAKLDLVVEAINDKDFNTYLDGKTIGKTAQNYINNQSRIMGRSVI